MQVLQFRFLVFSTRFLYIAQLKENLAVNCFSIARSAILFISRFRIMVTDVSVMTFLVLAQIVDLSDLDVMPLV